MSTNGQLVFTDVDKITFKGVGNASNAVVDTLTGKIGVGTDSPEANLHVLGNSYVSTNLELGGTLIMGTVNVESQHSLEAVTATGNTTPLTLEFTNPTTSLVASGNVEVGGNVVAGYLYGDGSNISGISSNLDQIVNNGNVTSNTVQFTNATTGLVTTANVEVGGDLTVSGVVGSSGTGALTIPSGTTAQQPTGVAGMIRFNSGVNRVEVYNGTAWQGLDGVSATQSGGSGTTTTSGGYKIHTFTSSGTLNVITGGAAEYLVVAGGGGGGMNAGSGGGAGGMLTGDALTIQSGSYTITVGTGGAGGSSSSAYGTTGNDSSIVQGTTSLVAASGGGYGVNVGNGGSGGSGGGGSDGENGIASGGSGISGQGNNGGNGLHPGGVNRAAGGGGGAGAVGQNSQGNSQGGAGGIGVVSTIRELGNVYYAGGGGGACHNSATGGSGGTGGGGKAGNSGGSGTSGNPGTSGTANTGGGGGGGAGYGYDGAGGGSGIVVIRYLQ